MHTHTHISQAWPTGLSSHTHLYKNHDFCGNVLTLISQVEYFLFLGNMGGEVWDAVKPLKSHSHEKRTPNAFILGGHWHGS